MKEYKLLKKYPSLPTDWEVGMKVGLGDRNYGYSPCAGNYSDCRKLDNSEVENNEEFWEIVVEKYYEILSFLNPDNQKIYTFKDDVLFAYTGSYRSLSYCMEHYKIYSVKRLSDNLVFSVGDRAQTIGKYPHTITSIEIRQKSINREEKDGIDRIWLNWGENEGGNWLENSELVKKPILTTFDGVELFEGDLCYIPQRRGENNWHDNPIEYKVAKDNKWDNIIIFADKNKAKEFIKENQKRYSLNDLREIVKKIGCFGTTLIDYLEKDGN